MIAQPTLQEIVDEQSRTITKLCEAIDPTFSHGPETEKICEYARKCREHFEKDAAKPASPPMNFILTRAELDAMPQVEGPSLAFTEEEKAEMNKPSPNGGIHFDGCFAVYGGRCTCHNISKHHC